MIAKSDLIILVVSSTLLGAAIYRWDQNTRNVNTSTVLANTTNAAPANDTITTATDQNSNATVLTGSQSALDDVVVDVANDVATDATTSVAIQEPTEIETAPLYSVHRVRSGDSLSEIASRYNTTVSELRSINGIRGSTIIIGQEILYPTN